jgi:hypothetical protein
MGRKSRGVRWEGFLNLPEGGFQPQSRYLRTYRVLYLKKKSRRVPASRRALYGIDLQKGYADHVLSQRPDSRSPGSVSSASSLRRVFGKIACIGPAYGSRFYPGSVIFICISVLNILPPYFSAVVILDGISELALLCYGHAGQAKVTRETVLNSPIRFSMRYAEAVFHF